MDTAYGVRTQLPNRCSRRVLNRSNRRARHRTDVLSDTRSKNLAPGARSDRPTEDIMSAAIAWGSTAPARPTPARPSRPRLVSVPTGEAVRATRKAPVRLTRLGRLAITLTMV